MKESAQPSTTYADIEERLGPFLLDVLIGFFAVPAFLLAGALATNLVAVLLTDEQIVSADAPSRWLAIAIAGVAGAVYFWLGNAWGGTPGKRAGGLKVVAVQGGEELGLRRGLARLAAAAAGACLLFLPYYLAAVDKKRQALHDKLAGSVVVRAGSNAPSTKT